MNKLKEKWWIVAIATFILGGTLGYTLYPTKTIEEKVKTRVQHQFKYQMERTQEESRQRVEKLRFQLAESERVSKAYKEETSKKLNSLTTENTKLKQKVKKRKFKLVKPDGTVIEKEFEESETDKTSTVVTEVRQEFNRKVSSIENKWKKIHVKRIQKIKEHYDKKLAEKKTEVVIKEKVVFKDRKVEVNKKNLRTEIGINNDLTPYWHSSYELWGPFFIGGGVSGSQKEFNDARVGIGLKF